VKKKKYKTIKKILVPLFLLAIFLLPAGPGLKIYVKIIL